jgi:hypothetical protein
MNVQLILVQAGIELLRHVIDAPITRRLIVEALCKISSGSLCSHLLQPDGTWKKMGGEEPSIMIHVTDADKDETTLTCGVEHARFVSHAYVSTQLDQTMAEVRGFIPNDYSRSVLWLNKESGDQDGAFNGSHQVPWISWDDFRLETIDAVEQFLESELFKTSQA